VEVAVPDVMPQIETIVFLMLENRSLDSTLGWLYDGTAPRHVYPEHSAKSFDGIRRGMGNGVGPTWFDATRGTQTFPDPCRVPRWNPYERLEHVHTQMYGDPNGQPLSPEWPDHAPMTGFAWDFSTSFEGPHRLDRSYAEELGCYSPHELPVLHGLARNFAVSDAWFSSVPTETDPNRAFSLCGTSLGVEVNEVFGFYDARTLFNGLRDRKTWAIYRQYHGLGDLDPIPLGPSYTVDAFPQIAEAIHRGEGELHNYEHLLDLLRDDRPIPEFCYVEPFWGGGLGLADGTDFIGLQGNDFHAPAWVGQAEWDLNELFELLRNHRQWEHMLFIVTFDEHGGTWDHVSPPKALPPDAKRGPARFPFTRMGPRVPTLLISPFIEPGTVFRAPAGSVYAFDHTSFIATILAWAGTDPMFIERMGDRVAHAPRFDGVLKTQRYEHPLRYSVPASYRNQGGPKGWHFPPGLDLDLDLASIGIREFWAAERAATTVDEFVAELRRRSTGPDVPPAGSAT
jgi:phospholipase C